MGREMVVARWLFLCSDVLGRLRGFADRIRTVRLLPQMIFARFGRRSIRLRSISNSISTKIDPYGSTAPLPAACRMRR